MKKILTHSALGLACLFMLSACGNKAAENTANSTTNTTANTTTNTNDNSTINTTNNTPINTNTPEHVALDFYKALCNLDFAKSRALSTQKAHELLSLIEVMAGQMSEEDMKKGKEASELIQSTKCNTSGNTATCQICCKDDGTEDTVKLEQVNGQWKVALSKEDM